MQDLAGMDNDSNTVQLMIKKMRPAASIPVYKHEGDAGFDLACVEKCVVPAHACCRVPTGLAFALPPFFEMQLRLRSGFAEKTPLIMPNAPATIDSGYRGELFILLRNISTIDWQVEKGERIAQGIIAPVFRATFVEVEILPLSERGNGAFGSTGRF